MTKKEAGAIFSYRNYLSFQEISMNNKVPFHSADILLPKSGFEKWACIACDQFTSQREYWERAYEIVGDAPSALKLVFPEVYLEDGDAPSRIAKINRSMEQYLNDDLFREYRDAMVLVERRLSDGRVRRGLVGAFRLEDYSFEKGAKPLIRPTEGTVLSRIPPRVNIRRDAALELPHIMVLMDDRDREIIEKIDTAKLEKLYDFELMLGGGHIAGWLLDKNSQSLVMTKLEKLYEKSGVDGDRLLFAVGDGNHSLATAKAAAEITGTEQSRFALAELVNIHDEAIDFEPIYRVLFNVDVRDFLAKLKAAFTFAEGKRVDYMSLEEEGSVYVNGLESDVLQQFIDDYIEANPTAQVDYIHGIEATKELAMSPNAIGFIFGGISKSELFDYVRENGILPRKTFSIGHAEDKRYYVEARKIR